MGIFYKRSTCEKNSRSTLERWRIDRNRQSHDSKWCPEELLGAAHAGCFSMQLSFMLENAGFEITEIILNLKASVPGITREKFEEISAKAKTGCPLSKALASTKITLVSELIN